MLGLISSYDNAARSSPIEVTMARGQISGLVVSSSMSSSLAFCLLMTGISLFFIRRYVKIQKDEMLFFSATGQWFILIFSLAWFRSPREKPRFPSGSLLVLKTF